MRRVDQKPRNSSTKYSNVLMLRSSRLVGVESVIIEQYRFCLDLRSSRCFLKEGWCLDFAGRTLKIGNVPDE